MCVIGRSELQKLVERFKCVYPFEDRLLDGDGYVLTVKEETTLNYLEHRNLISYEVVFTPPSYVAHLTAKSRYGRLGLSFLNAAKVHSGYVGRVALELVNLNNERKPITIKSGDPLIHLEFVTRDGDASPYAGEYQFQYMTDEEVKIYGEMLAREFAGLYTKESLSKQSEIRILPQ